jgi:hypothetical protein
MAASMQHRSIRIGRHSPVGLDEAAEGHTPHHSESLDHFMGQVLDFPEDKDDFLT